VTRGRRNTLDWFRVLDIEVRGIPQAADSACFPFDLSCFEQSDTSRSVTIQTVFPQFED
jgi:hypothetical protein